jgi:hypothetical protein
MLLSLALQLHNARLVLLCIDYFGYQPIMVNRLLQGLAVLATINPEKY